MLCTQVVFCFDTQSNLCSPDVLSLQFSIFMNNLSSYCGLVNAKILPSDKDLRVPNATVFTMKSN